MNSRQITDTSRIAASILDDLRKAKTYLRLDQGDNATESLRLAREGVVTLYAMMKEAK